MSFPRGPRIVRKQTAPVMTGRDGYVKAREHLRRDFSHRCAYCMIHEHQIGGPEVFVIDHFHPRSKGGRVNDYDNLCWVCAACNRMKGDSWPTTEEQREGTRFADPCREQDYGVHFVEDEEGKLAAKTRCGAYHVLTLRLNRSSRVRYRLARNHLIVRFAEAKALVERLEREPASDLKREIVMHMRNEVESLRTELAIAIPYIPPLRNAADNSAV